MRHAGPPRILIVDDEVIIAQDMADSLEAMGFEIAGFAANAKDAIDLAGRAAPDMVLMDIMLQGPMDGIQAVEAIRSSFNIPIIYVTAFTDDAILERARLTMPYGYIVKPYEDRELRFTIEMAYYKFQSEERIRKTKDQYQALLETSGAIPWEMDPATRSFTYIGPQIAELLGYGAASWTGLDVLLSRVHAEDREGARGFYEEAHGELCAPGGKELEFRMTRSDGKAIWVRDTVSNLTRDGGRVYLRGFMMDVTRRKEAELERERYIAELKEAIEKIRTLHGLLPICAWCKKIRDDKGYWQQVEVYLEEHSGAEFTHSMCPECKKNMEKELG